MKNLKEKVRKIVTYYSDNGTLSCPLSEEQIDGLVELLRTWAEERTWVEEGARRGVMPIRTSEADIITGSTEFAMVDRARAKALETKIVDHTVGNKQAAMPQL